MIEEAYVSFETAKLLKEKGFDGICQAYYDSHGFSMFNGKGDNYETRPSFILAPTQQMAMRWLREVHNIEICVNLGLVGKDHKKMHDWCPVIVKENRLEYPITYPDGSCSVLADSYEEAVEAAIKYCLTKLI